MTFPTDWDVEKYRVDYESEEHWELRRRFLEAHKSSYPEERLVCLTQVFYNVEFMGCRYPEKTMRLVAKLSKGVADEHREKMKTKLQRTFVQASDAASTKVKGRTEPGVAAPTKVLFLKSSDSQIKNEQQSRNIQHNVDSDPHAGTPGRHVLRNQKPFEVSHSKRSSESNAAVNKKSKKNDETLVKDCNLLEVIGDHSSEEVNLKVAFSQLVLLDQKSAMGTLTGSAGSSKMNFNLTVNPSPSGGSVAALAINGIVLAKSTKPTQADAKASCAKEALEKLQKYCYTLVTKDRFATSAPVVEKSEMSNKMGKKNEPDQPVMDTRAERMMKLMGWGGAGLGKNQQGRTEPVKAAEHIRRAGLGASILQSGAPKFEKHIRGMLLNFMRSNAGHDLVFAADFSKEERAVIHRISQKVGLKSTSYGAEPNRQLIVAKKRTPWEILQGVLQSGGCSEKYEVIPPSQG